MRLKHQENNRVRSEIGHFTKLEHIWWGARTFAGQRRYDRKLEAFNKICKLGKKNFKILEIGCGDGEFTKRLINLKAKIIATDVTPKVILRARKKIKAKNIKFLIKNSEKLDFPDNSFDIVCGVSILHHINYEAALQEAYRVVKKNGQIFFSEPNLLNPHTFIGLKINFFRPLMEYSDDETALLRWIMQRKLGRIGFRKVKVLNYDFLHPKTPRFAVSFIENVSDLFEKLPVIKEISGSLIIHAIK